MVQLISRSKLTHNVFSIPSIIAQKKQAMVTLTKNKIQIEFAHPFPEEGVTDLQEAIITVLQNQNLDIYSDLKDVHESNVVILDLLKALLNITNHHEKSDDDLL